MDTPTELLQIKHKENEWLPTMIVTPTEKTDPTLHALGYQWVRSPSDYSEGMGTLVYFHKAKWKQV